MEAVVAAIHKNPTKDSCVRRFEEARSEWTIGHQERLWGATVHPLTPSRLTTAWLMITDPLMMMSGEMYRQKAVRDEEFKLQKRGTEEIRGVRILTKKAIGEALSADRPTEKQVKVFAGVLHKCHGVHTVFYNLEKKGVEFYPEDLRMWSLGKPIIWVDSRLQNVLEWTDASPQEQEPRILDWITARESEGWSIPWPDSNLSMELLKEYVKEHSITVKAWEGVGKLKKADYARCVGRCEAIEHLSAAESKGVADGYLE
jgi:hypothetical protein